MRTRTRYRPVFQGSVFRARVRVLLRCVRVGVHGTMDENDPNGEVVFDPEGHE